MKSIYYISFYLSIPLLLSAQSTNKNYIVTTKPTVSITNIKALADINSLTTIQYFDGLGRPLETVKKAQSSNDGGTTWMDLVSLTEFDGIGRDYRHWLPIANSGNGEYVDLTVFSSSNNTKSTHYNSDAKPYAEILYGEHSPLNRISGQKQPGDWQNKPSGISYQTNSADEVCYYDVNDNNQLVRDVSAAKKYYAAGTLYKTITTDEDGKSTTQYKNKQEQVVMTRSDADVDTYYIYNDLGQQCYVLSPEASDKLSSFTGQITMPDKITAQTDANTTALWQLAYHYQYDTQGNCIYKKLPGCEPIYMVYDQANRLVLSQDGNQRVIADGKNQWTVTKYDALGRIIFSGISKEILTSKTLTDLVTEYSTRLITNADFSDATPLLINYYDNYNYQDLSAYTAIKPYLIYKDKLTDATLDGFDAKYSNIIDNVDISAKGLLTGTAVSMLDNSVTLVTAMYYDDKGRLVQSHSNNHLNGYDHEYFHYSFSGQVLNKRHIHKAFTNDEITENYRFTYDQVNRLTGEYHALNTQPEATLATITYDELGRVNKKILHGGIQTINYTYNIRNWLKSISSPKFTETLYYQDSQDGNSYYNGNISEQDFGVGDDKRYLFSYDKLNRLTSAHVGSQPKFNEEIGNYDKNGNIKSIKRYGYVYDYGHNIVNGLIDDMTLTYNGNQLASASDAVDQSTVIATNDFVNKQDALYPTEYLYDANGNQTADLNKGIAWTRYNLLNLPQKVQFRNRSKNEYLYDASGVKHVAKYNYSTSTSLIPLGATTQESTVTSTFQIDYCGNYVYEKSGTGAGNPVLKRILTSEGYVQTYGSGLSYLGYWNYVYFLKDHLGNTRVNLFSYYLKSNTNKTYSASDQIDYYPFGMERSNTGQSGGGCFNSGTNPYLYNGKEIDRMNGLNMSDYGARWKDLGFTSVDPLAEKKPWLSPYAYCSDNPVNKIDPDGKDDIFSISGKFIKSTSTGSRALIQNGNNFYVFSKLYQIQSDQNAANRASMRIEFHYVNQQGYKGTYGVSAKIPSALGYTTSDKKVYFSVEGIKNGYFDNFYNIKSTLFHESDLQSGHKSETIPYKDYKYMDHLKVYEAQINNDDFKKCTEDYKMGTVSSFGNYLQMAWQFNEISDKERDTIQKDFNASHDYQIEIESDRTNVTHNGQTESYKNNVNNPH